MSTDEVHPEMTGLSAGNRFRAILAILGIGAACGGGAADLTRGEAGRETGSGAGGAVDASDDLPKATDFADVNIDQNFTEPVWLPPPSTTVQGDATSLVGSWVQVGSDGGQCPPGSYRGLCWHLEIQNDTGGTVSGTVQADPINGLTPGVLPPVSGPFAPATDPNVGYPTTVAPDNYTYLRTDVVPNVPFQLFDGVVTSGSFTFWFSPIDLWSAWCAMQNPSPWTIGSQREYRCVPQTANQTTTDLGKLALCTSAVDGPLCTVPDNDTGVQQPCVCLQPHDAGGNAPLCGNTVCECSATECRADVRSEEISATLQLSAGQLVGSLDLAAVPGPLPALSMTLQRVAP
jgi:hypothetical protein